MRSPLLLAGAALLCACLTVDTPLPEDHPSNPASESYAASTGVDISKMTKLPNGVYYLDVTGGDGPPLSEKRLVLLTYAAMLPNGFVFLRAETQQQIDLRSVLSGFADGVVGMKAGGSRKIVVPSPLAYGPSGAPPLGVPSNSTVVYDVSLISF
jgi:FKBP-type peptidyl-prolyl cis-trans isomerase